MIRTELRPLAEGDWIKDNDPFHSQRKPLRIEGFRGDGIRTYVLAYGPGHDCAYPRVRDIHLDGKPRRSGWSRVEGPRSPRRGGRDCRDKDASVG
jgi:hypothetical protein